MKYTMTNDEREVATKRLMASYAGMLTDGTEQSMTYGALLEACFRMREGRHVVGHKAAELLAEILDGRGRDDLPR